MFLKELGRFVDFLPFRDSVDGARLSRKEYGMERIIRVRNVFERIAASGAETFYLAPRFIARDQFADESSEPARRVGYRAAAGMFRRLSRVLRDASRRGRGGKPRFVFCYHPEPDHITHRKGTSAPETAAVIAGLDALLERAASRLAGCGATILVTADHGLVDTPSHLWLDENPEAYRSLVLSPFPEKRFLSFFLTPRGREGFAEKMHRYEGDFRLMRGQEILERGILGRGEVHAKVGDFLGDWVALATGGAQMHTRVVHPEREERVFLAHHAGLRPEEMLVPLIRIDL